MRITAVETIRPKIQPNLLFLQLHTEDGRVGLGEAFFGGRTVESYLHESVAEVLLSTEDPSPEAMARTLTSYTGYAGAGVETRGNGAVDLALWDLLGQGAGLPLVKLFGGPVQESLPIYNTCAGPGYISRSTRQQSDNWGVPTAGPERWDDLDAFLNRPGQLARELWNEGIRGMKVWPFDQAAEATNGTDISAAGLSRGLTVIEAIRAEVGFDLALMVELHGLWNRRGATTILQALEPYRPYWVEDPIRPDAVDALAALTRDTDVPIATGETVVGSTRVPTVVGARRRRRGDGRRAVDRWAHRGTQDREPRRHVRRTGGAARLHRTRHPRGLRASHPVRAERADPGDGPSLPQNLVRRTRRRTPGDRRRQDRHAARSPATA